MRERRGSSCLATTAHTYCQPAYFTHSSHTAPLHPTSHRHHWYKLEGDTKLSSLPLQGGTHFQFPNVDNTMGVARCYTNRMYVMYSTYVHVCRAVRTHHGATRDMVCIDLYNLQGRGGERKGEEGRGGERKGGKGRGREERERRRKSR